LHDIEPHFGWRNKYRAEQDQYSPFYGRQYSEFGFSNRIYNYLIHPQWDEFGAETLYAKILFVDYEERYAIVELIGEWNDAVHNDIMHFKRFVIDQLLEHGIKFFILVMEGVLNFHGEDTDYYEEWIDEISDLGGWVALVNVLGHVRQELDDTKLDQYLHYGDYLNDLTWRPQKPSRFFEAIEGLLQTETRRLY
jgi:hypothetical protein